MRSPTDPSGRINSACDVAHAFHFRDPRHRFDRVDDPVGAVRLFERQVDIRQEVVADLVDVAVQRAARVEGGDEDRSAQGEGDEGQRQPAPPPEGVAQREQHRTRQAADAVELAVDPVVRAGRAGLVVAAQRLDHGDPGAEQDRDDPGHLRDDQRDPQLQPDDRRMLRKPCRSMLIALAKFFISA